MSEVLQGLFARFDPRKEQNEEQANDGRDETDNSPHPSITALVSSGLEADGAERQRYENPKSVHVPSSTESGAPALPKGGDYYGSSRALRKDGGELR
jgi:hypothetical protein